MAASSTPGDVNEGRSKAMHHVHAIIQVLHALCRLGRKVFEGVGCIALTMGRCQFLGDMHGGGEVVMSFEVAVGEEADVEVVKGRCGLGELHQSIDVSGTARVAQNAVGMRRGS